MKRLPLLQAVVVGYESESGGTRLALFVQPRPGSEWLSVDEVQRICQDDLPRHKVPATVEIVDRLPLNDAMKVDRTSLTRHAKQQAAVSMPTHSFGSRDAI